MSRKIVMYQSQPIVGLDFTGTPVHTVPNQSMTLMNVLQRFTRRQELPLEKSAVYIEGLGDLEKLQFADLTIIDELKSVWRDRAEQARQREEEAARVAAEEAAKKQSVSSDAASSGAAPAPAA